MSDITERLRSLYVQHGTNYVQEAAREIENLRATLRSARSFIADARRGIKPSPLFPDAQIRLLAIAYDAMIEEIDGAMEKADE